MPTELESNLDPLSHRFLAALLSMVVAGACTLDRSGTAPSGDGVGGASGSSGGSSGRDGGGGTGTIPIPDGGECFPGTKPCEGLCVPRDDPQYGCALEACSACELPNATPKCEALSCQIEPPCHAGFNDCDGEPLNGCETNVNGDPRNCGECGIDCLAVATNRICVNGKCEVSDCPVLGTQDCNGDEADDCETFVHGDPNNCGFCGNICNLPHAVPTCSGGSCIVAPGPGGCIGTWRDCDGNSATGCEVNTRNNTAHCGMCNNQCPSINGTATCSNSMCGIVCNSGRGNCDGNLNNGCETNTNGAVSHCGGCNQPCSGNGGTPSCSGGNCSITCDSGRRDCTGGVADGCETNITNDPNNCDGCGLTCDSTNGTPGCSGGSCTISCDPGWDDCTGGVADGCETFTNSSIFHCGGCMQRCSDNNGTPSCSGGNCSITCDSGWGDCDGNIDNGCETNIDTSLQHCGGCMQPCISDAGPAMCVNGMCI